jgi:1-acyl-sn-glycerol-3-phosphate acyltransferase
VIGAKCVRVNDSGSGFHSHNEYRRLMQSKYIGIFPEATRSMDGNVASARGGAIKISSRKGIPLIPVRLEGFYKVLPRNRKVPIPHPCRIIFGQECFYDLAEVKGKSESSLDQCMTKILQTMEYAAIPSVPDKEVDEKCSQTGSN